MGRVDTPDAWRPLAALEPGVPFETVCAVLLTDVVDSTLLTTQVGDRRTSQLWVAHDRLARNLLRDRGGLEIDRADGLLLAFPDVESAVTWATAYHAGLRQLNPPMKARVGVHFGTVVLHRNPPPDIELGAKPIELDGIAKPFGSHRAGQRSDTPV